MADTDASFAEGAADYLASKNFKSLVEWVTAEVLFSRPSDPLTFVRDVVSKKIEERGSRPYHPADNDRYLRQCYEDPTIVTENEHTGKETSTPAGNNAAAKEMQDRLSLLERLMSSSRAIAKTLDVVEATSSIIQETCALILADRATLFKLDKNRNELQLMVAEGAKNIFLPVGKGIAGTVASTAKTINIRDAYLDDRFDSSHDKATGYRTKSILACPVHDGDGKVVGVIQAINSSKGQFDQSDEEVLSILADQAGVALTNAQRHSETLRSQRKVQAMLDVVRAMHGDLGTNSLMFTITQRAPQLVDADRCTFFLANHKSKELWSMQGEVDIRIPIDKGIAGAVATSGNVVNIPDAYEDDRFNKDVDKASGYRTKSILCMPVKANDGTVLAVIQLINKTEGRVNTSDCFTEEDETLMESFLTIAGPILQNSQLFQATAKKQDEGTEFSGRSVRRTGSGRSEGLAAAPIIEEGDEDEEDDEDEE